MTGISGGFAKIAFDWVGQTAYDKIFGHGMKITTNSRKNNVEPLYGLGNRTASALVAKQYEGEFAIEYILANPFVLEAVFGTVDHDTNTNTYTYPASGQIPKPRAMDIINVIDDDGSEDLSILFHTAVMNNMNISLNKGEAVKVTHDIYYLYDEFSTTASSFTQPTESFNPYAFQNGTLYFQSKDTNSDGDLDNVEYASVQSIEISLNHNIEKIFGIGSRWMDDFAPKNLEVTAKASVLLTEANRDFILLALIGDATTPIGNSPITASELGCIEFPSMTLDLEDCDGNKITIVLDGIMVDSLAMPESPEDIIKMDIDFKVRSAHAIAKPQ